MCEILEKINPGDEREISEKEWDAIEKLLRSTGLDDDIEIDRHGKKWRFWDKDEDRPLVQEPTLELIAKKYIKKTFDEYGMTPEECGLLEGLFSGYHLSTSTFPSDTLV